MLTIVNPSTSILSNVVLSEFMLSIVVPSVNMLSVTVLNVIMLSILVMSVVMLGVVAPNSHYYVSCECSIFSKYIKYQ